eukprot:138609-Amphidinium_carterae.1
MSSLRSLVACPEDAPTPLQQQELLARLGLQARLWRLVLPTDHTQLFEVHATIGPEGAPKCDLVLYEFGDLQHFDCLIRVDAYQALGMNELRAAIRDVGLTVGKFYKAIHLRCKLRDLLPHPLLDAAAGVAPPVAQPPSMQFHRSLVVLSWNVSALSTSKEDLLTLAAKHDADVLCVQETHLVTNK